MFEGGFVTGFLGFITFGIIGPEPINWVGLVFLVIAGIWYYNNRFGGKKGNGGNYYNG